MSRLSLRWCALTALLLWQGGGTFYAGIAIPIGRRVLHDQLYLQNRITQRATHWLNGIGAVALVILSAELLADRSRYRRQRILLLTAMFLSLVAIFVLHSRLDLHLATAAKEIPFPPKFRVEHQLYLAISVGQFLLALVYLAISLAAWQCRGTGDSVSAGHQ